MGTSELVFVALPEKTLALEATLAARDHAVMAQDPPEVEDVRSKILEKRRGMVTGATPAVSKETPERRTKRSQPVVRLPIIVAAVLVVIAGGVFAFLTLHEDSSEQAVVRRRLIAAELSLDPAKKDAELVPLDQQGAKGLQLVIALLTDSSKAQTSASHSDNTVQRVAHGYLMRQANALKIEPPAVGVDLAKAINEGGAVPPAKWTEAQAAWQKWLGDAQAKGAVK